MGLGRIGIYGISSTGKSTISKGIEESLYNFKSIDGSDIINKVCPGGLKEFKELDAKSQVKYRKDAILFLEEYQNETQQNLVISGHYSFLNSDGAIENVWNEADENFYTDIIYIKDQSLSIYDRFVSKNKTLINIETIDKWLMHEEIKISSLTRQTVHIIESNNIQDKLNKARELINSLILKAKVTDIIKRNRNKLVILFDADGTLISYDSAKVMSKYLKEIDSTEIKRIFQSYGDYCFSAFYDVAKYYSKNNSHSDFIKASKKAALEIEIRNDFVDFINNVNATFVIVTAGFQILWKELINKYNFKNVNLIAGNTLYDDSIIGQNEKGYVVDVAKSYNKKVVCFGDALVDKEMFIKSDKGYLIVNERKKSIIPHINSNSAIRYVTYEGIKVQGMLETNFEDIKKKMEELNND